MSSEFGNSREIDVGDWGRLGHSIYQATALISSGVIWSCIRYSSYVATICVILQRTSNDALSRGPRQTAPDSHHMTALVPPRPKTNVCPPMPPVPDTPVRTKKMKCGEREIRVCVEIERLLQLKQLEMSTKMRQNGYRHTENA